MRRKLRYSLLGVAAAAALVVVTSSPANAYYLLGPKWNGTVYVSILPGQPTANENGWTHGVEDFNDLTDATMYETSGSVAAIYARTVDNNEVDWDGITYWSNTGGTFNTPTNAYLNSVWTDTYDPYVVRGVAEHELGHALGLDHNTDGDGCFLMNPYTGDRCGIYMPYDDEINGINALY